MKRNSQRASILLAVGVTAITQTQAAILAWESFGDATDGAAFGGYAGTDGVTETGFGADSTWTSNNTGTVAQLKARDEAGWDPGIAGGYSVDSDGTSQEHWLEHQNVWNPTVGTRPLGSTIDLTTDGTYYMSFFSRAGNVDVILQMGFSNDTNELMWGQGYNRGVTSYYGPLGTAADTNNSDPDTDITVTAWNSVFWVTKLEKTNSGTTDDLAMSISYFDLAADNSVGGSDPASWTREMSLAGVDASFDELQLKIDGGSGQWPGVDELRVGESWADVTGVPEPGVAFLGCLGAVAFFRRRR